MCYYVFVLEENIHTHLKSLPYVIWPYSFFPEVICMRSYYIHWPATLYHSRMELFLEIKGYIFIFLGYRDGQSEGQQLSPEAEVESDQQGQMIIRDLFSW